MPSSSNNLTWERALTGVEFVARGDGEKLELVALAAAAAAAAASVAAAFDTEDQYDSQLFKLKKM